MLVRIQDFVKGGSFWLKSAQIWAFFMKNPVILKKCDILGWFYQTPKPPPGSANAMHLHLEYNFEED